MLINLDSWRLLALLLEVNDQIWLIISINFPQWIEVNVLYIGLEFS